jgi:hypothetical protein
MQTSMIINYIEYHTKLRPFNLPIFFINSLVGFAALARLCAARTRLGSLKCQTGRCAPHPQPIAALLLPQK